MLIIEASEQPISIVQLTLIKSTSVFLSDWLNYFGMSTVNVDFKFSRHSFWSALFQMVNLFHVEQCEGNLFRKTDIRGPCFSKCSVYIGGQ